MEQSSKQTKGKGKASQIIERAVWDPQSIAIFVNLCVQEVLSGRRPQTHLTKEGWENVRVGFERQTGRQYTQLQFKNRWDTLRTEWNLWNGLLKGETGLGLNPITGAIDASDEWWKIKLQRYPEAKMFRYKPLPHAAELDILFVNSGATGDDAYAPSSGRLPACLRDFEDGLLNSDDEIEPLDGLTPDEPLVTPMASDGSSRKRAAESSRATKLMPKKKKMSGSSQVSHSLDRIADQMRSSNESYRGEVEDKYSAAKCMAILNAMPEVNKTPLVGVAVMAFQSRIFRECFITSDPENRLVLLETRRVYDGKI